MGEGWGVFQCRRCLIPSSEIKILTGTETHPTFPSRFPLGAQIRQITFSVEKGRFLTREKCMNRVKIVQDTVNIQVPRTKFLNNFHSRFLHIFVASFL